LPAFFSHSLPSNSVVTTEFDGKEWEKNAGNLAPLEAR